jgi:hypothetical protein
MQLCQIGNLIISHAAGFAIGVARTCGGRPRKTPRDSPRRAEGHLVLPSRRLPPGLAHQVKEIRRESQRTLLATLKSSLDRVEDRAPRWPVAANAHIISLAAEEAGEAKGGGAGHDLIPTPQRRSRPEKDLARA